MAAREVRHHPDYLFAIDLYNHGYFWEAHEKWEGIWHALSRAGEAADLLKALIQIAAAQLKVIQEQPAGVDILSTRALAAIERLARAGGPRLLGLDLDTLVRETRAWFAAARAGWPIGPDPRFPHVRVNEDTPVRAT
jgi:uncharacterized protein